MRCDLRGISIHYESVGRGRPLVILHASPGDGRRAMGQVEPAVRDPKGWRRIYPDLPGHGKTPGSDRIRDIDDYLGVLLEYVDAVSRGGRFALGGISFGAYLALGIARKRSRRLDGLLLSVPEVSFSPSEDRKDREEGLSSEPSPEEAARRWKGYVEDTSWLQNLPWHDLSFDLYQSPRPCNAPSLFLLGRQDSSFRYRAYWKLLPGFPRATFAVLDGAGHDLWVDRPELAGALVREWLDRVHGRSSRTPRPR